MKIPRSEAWGKIEYDTEMHRFSYYQNSDIDTVPYPCHPLVLNVDLTMKCNMNCMHCVAKDFVRQEDLSVTPQVIDWINASPFMIVVITGGEPFLPDYETQLITLLTKIKNKGLIIDTNGTLIPSAHLIDVILQMQALIRVSWDSARPADEIYFRHVKHSRLINQLVKGVNLEYYMRRIQGIEYFASKGVPIAVQSVLHKKNYTSIEHMSSKLRELRIKQWYIQRFIPSYHAKDASKYDLDPDQRQEVFEQLAAASKRENIECIIKKDKRHNSVFLLASDGKLYTQGQKPGQKIFLGNIANEIRYFDYVSAPDHFERYY